MQIAAVTNLKGGVGKTTTTVNLGAGLAIKGVRVLLVDVDAQGNLATALGVKPRHTLYEALVDGKPAAKCLTEARPNLQLLAADDSLMNAQPLMAQRPDWAHLLGRAIKPLAADFDLALIDCSASLSVMNVSALLCASHILVPTAIEHLAIHGIELLQRQLSRVSSPGRIRCIIPTMFDSRQRQAQDLLGSLRSQYGSLVTEPIRVNVRLSEAPAFGRTIYEHDARSRGALDYAQLVEHVAGLLGIDTTPRSVPAPPISNGASAKAAPSANGMQPPMFRGVTLEQCPTCQHPLEQAVLAGYRIRYCNHCHYKRQELIQGVRR